MTVDESNQWELNGDCSKCRRQKFCKKACTIRKRKQTAIIQNAVMNKFMEVPGVREIMNMNPQGNFYL